MPERNVLLITSALFFALLAKDIAVPAIVLMSLAGLRWLGLNGFGGSIWKGQKQ